MHVGTRTATATDQRGVALPIAMMVLLLLTSLTLSFLSLGSSEPTIAANLRGGEQALALAEAGVERALWALANPTVSGLSDPNAIPAAYNNGQLFTISGIGTGAYAITVSLVAAPDTWQINSRGYVLRNGVAVPAQPAQLASTNIAAQRAIQLRATVGPSVGGPGAPLNQNFPGAVSAAGSISMSGNSIADGANSAPGTPNSCPNKAGDTNRDNGQDGISRSGSAETNGTVADGAVAYSDPKLVGSQKLPVSQFNQSLLTDAQLNALKALAQADGTYVKPPSGSQISVTINDGLVFVDRPDPSTLADVRVSGTNTGGWLIVLGKITVDGNVIAGGVYRGLFYALDTITMNSVGPGAIYGAMVAANVSGSATAVTMSGNAKVYYDCSGVGTGGGTFSTGFQDELNRSIVSIVAGSWVEAEAY
jgi:Tfp pilus assembly protein PilX